MFTFEKIFKREFQIENDKSLDKMFENDKSLYTLSLSNILLFTEHFVPRIFKTSNNYSWEKYIKYKFFTLNNFLQNNSNCNYIDDEYKERILSLFSNTQRHIMALYRFKNICFFKRGINQGET